MDAEKRRSASLAFLIILIIVVAAGWFIWANYLAFGTIILNHEPPFTVEVENGEVFECSSSPCEIKQKTGRQSILISKEGFPNEVESVYVELWKDTEVDFEFDFEPYLLEAPDYDPSIIEGTGRNFKLIYDPSISMQKLVDEQNQEVVFFPERLESADVFASENSTIILSPSGNYRVDNVGKTRVGIEPLEVESGKWSPDGSYFLFQNEEGLRMLSPTNSLQDLEIDIDIEELFWTRSNELVTYEDGQFIFHNTSGQVTEAFNTYLEGEAENIYITADSSSIYFTVGEQGYRFVVK